MTFTSSDVIALVALVAGTGLSAASVVLSYRSRTATYREQLHAEQLKLLTELATAMSRCSMYFAECYTTLKRGDKERFLNLTVTRPPPFEDLLQCLSRGAFMWPKTLADTGSDMRKSLQMLRGPWGTPEDADTRLKACETTIQAFRDAARENLGIDALSSETFLILNLRDSPPVAIVAKK